MSGRPVWRMANNAAMRTAADRLAPAFFSIATLFMPAKAMTPAWRSYASAPLFDLSMAMMAGACCAFGSLPSDIAA